MKLWEKGAKLDKKIEQFTVGNDHQLDVELVPYDCKASIAHAHMLEKISILTHEEANNLVQTLQEIITLHKEGKFPITIEDEDCHTAIEKYLTETLGDVGKKIHTARSRNDQILTALRLYEKEQVKQLQTYVSQLIAALDEIIQEHANEEMPGYTHMQKAMPTTLGTWIGSFHAALQDGLKLLKNAEQLIDQSPLGSAAGFGVPVLETNKESTAKEMGFSKIMENPTYAQLSRGLFENHILHVCTHLLFVINKLATDILLFSTQEFGFVHLPKEYCTGSSIMPNKKNLDVFELLRAKYHIALGEEIKCKTLIANLPSGYNRDLQLTKEPIMKTLAITLDCIDIAAHIVPKLEFDFETMKNAVTKEMHSTAEVYKLVKKGIPFREAYKDVAKNLEKSPK